ncbi:MAG: immunity 17 family protein [Myxococcota bacterium]
MTTDTVAGVVLAGVGVFSLYGAGTDADWFMASRRAALFVRMFGRGGARLFYAVLGIVLIGIGVASIAGLA